MPHKPNKWNAGENTTRETFMPATLIAVLAAITLLGPVAPAQAASEKPNIVFILVDNVGWGNFGVYGGTIPTPRIDRLANEGVRFNNYNVEVQCTPTRSAIHTGRYPVRSGTYAVPLPGQGEAGMAPWEYTIAELLSDAGYATALYGKWHLGEHQGRLPTDQGYDEGGVSRTAWTRRATPRGRCSRRAACRCL
jgi:arylsulfatase A-like enzyme